jgi:predicted phosphodiesterase
MRVGLISDTHDLLRPEALERLRGADHIIHAGDVCSREILDALATQVADCRRGIADRARRGRRANHRVARARADRAQGLGP